MSAAKTKAQNIIEENAVGMLSLPSYYGRRLVLMYNVAVFSKSYCPYCKATKSLLDSLGAKYYAIELDQVGMFHHPFRNRFPSSYFLTFITSMYVLLTTSVDDGAAIQSALKEINGQTSVPNIYIKKEHIGGNSDLQARKGELKNLLTDAGAL